MNARTLMFCGGRRTTTGLPAATHSPWRNSVSYTRPDCGAACFFYQNSSLFDQVAVYPDLERNGLGPDLESWPHPCEKVFPVGRAPFQKARAPPRFARAPLSQ